MSRQQAERAEALPIDLADVEGAAARIRDGISETPAAASRAVSAATGADVYLKFETFHATASFKERGALNRLLQLTAEERQRGVSAVSAGNHAQAVAYHAGRLGIPATIVMPKGTPFTKVRRTEELGAEVVLAGKTFAEAAQHAAELRDARQLVHIHTFDDPAIMAGQGTAALEFLKSFPDLELLVVPIGGGGLISGVAVAAKAIKPDIQIFGVQSEACPSMKAALAGEEMGPVGETIAEGIAVKEPGGLTRAVVRELVDDILIVPEATIERAINMLIEQQKVVVEGAGAASLAALLEYPDRFDSRRAGLFLTGGNIDTKVLAYSLMRGLALDGRISRLKVATPDQPGSLARITEIVAAEGGNVVEVYHQRQFAPISLRYTEIEVVVETKDRHHLDRLIKALTAAEFNVMISRPDGGWTRAVAE